MPIENDQGTDDPDKAARVDGADVFISYSRVDSAFVDRISQYLRVSGFKSWIDRTELRGGQVWRSQIDEAIRGCRRLVVVLSPEGSRSLYVMEECDLALQHNKPIIPLLYRDIDKPPSFLQWFHSIDFRQDFFQGMEQLLQTLRENRAAWPSEQNAQLSTDHSSLDFMEQAEIARRLLIFLEDRRVLYTWRTYGNMDIEVPAYAVSSVEKIRARLITDLENLKARSSVLWRCVAALRFACARFMNLTQAIGDLDTPIHSSSRLMLNGNQFRFLLTLGELRGIFGIYIGEISSYYGLEITYGGLKSLLPSGELPPIELHEQSIERDVAESICQITQDNVILRSITSVMDTDLDRPERVITSVKALQQQFMHALGSLEASRETYGAIASMYLACSTFILELSRFRLERPIGHHVTSDEFAEDETIVRSKSIDADGVFKEPFVFHLHPAGLGLDRDILYLVSLGALRTHLGVRVGEMSARFALPISEGVKSLAPEITE